MASFIDYSSGEDEDNFIVLGIPVPELSEGQPQKKPITIQDLTARDKQGRRRFHGAFTGGFSAGFFNTVGTKEGFTPSTFVSSRSNKGQRSESRPEDYMDDEDFDEHGIAPRKFATTGTYSSEDRKRKHHEDDTERLTSSHVSLVQPLTDLITPEQLSIGVKILRKMGWREGQGVGPRMKRNKLKRKGQDLCSTDSTLKVYGCALPPPEEEDCESDDFVPEHMSSITFAPKDICSILVETAKDNVHGLGYRGIDPSLALPGSYISLFDSDPVRSHRSGKGIQGQAFGVGAFEEEDEDIYAVDNMSKYDITMKPDDDEEDSKFGWTAPRSHGKQVVPVSYVGKLLEGFTLSHQSLQPTKKYPPPDLPRDFKPQHWSRKRRETSHLTDDGRGVGHRDKMSAVDRGLLLGETPVMNSVFDLVPKEDKARIEAVKQNITVTKFLASRANIDLGTRFHSVLDDSAEIADASLPEHSGGQSAPTGISNTYLTKFKPADVTLVKPSQDEDRRPMVTAQSDNKTPLFQASLSFQPFRKDPVKQMRYNTYLASVKQGISDPYSSVDSRHLTEWEKSREKEEFYKASKIYRPMSEMMSSRFVRGSMIDDDRVETPLDTEKEKTDQAKAAEMKMFGKLTREEFEWHPDKLLCRRFNVPNPYPGSDLVGLPTVKRDKYSVFNFLNFGDYQQEMQEPSTKKSETEPELKERTMKPIQTKKAAMASIFKVLDDQNFHQPGQQSTREADESSATEIKDKKSDQQDKNDGNGEREVTPDKDLFRAIFKNSDSESSSDESDENVKNEVSSEGEERKSDSEVKRNSKRGLQEDLLKTAPEISRVYQITKDVLTKEDMPSVNSSASSTIPDSEVRPRKVWSLFNVLSDLDKNNTSVDSQHASELSTKSEAALSRLSPPCSSHPDESDMEGSYNVRLPPAAITIPNKQVSDYDRTHKTDNSRDRERKEKKKKSKHKKGKKHRKHRKSSKSHKKRVSSGSEAATETSDVSDSELLHRFKQVSHSEALSEMLKQL